ncbi:MAG: CopD family protein [Bacteroidia bacterium]|nr:CopD family protein [Bacteroidia bacterium]
MEYLYLKSLHIVFMVTWFAGLFYMVRLMVYTREAQDKPMEERRVLTPQLLLMQGRLWYIIAWPGAIGTLIFGVWMLIVNPGLLKMPWMHVKLLMVAGLLAYHLRCEKLYRNQKKGFFSKTSFRLRLFNEIPTLILVAVVFLAVVKSESGLMWGGSAVALLGILIFAASWVYKKKRESKQDKL